MSNNGAPADAKAELVAHLVRNTEPHSVALVQDHPIEPHGMMQPLKSSEILETFALYSTSF